jgi:hypothetical protein
MWHVYYRSSKFIIPTTARVDAGFFIDIEPVSIVPGKDEAALRASIQTAVERGNPTIAARPRTELPKPVVLAHAGVKSWSAFERGSICWTLTQEDGCYVVTSTGRPTNGKWVDDPANTVRVDLNDGSQGLTAALLSRVKILTAASFDK